MKINELIEKLKKLEGEYDNGTGIYLELGFNYEGRSHWRSVSLESVEIRDRHVFFTNDFKGEIFAPK